MDNKKTFTFPQSLIFTLNKTIYAFKNYHREMNTGGNGIYIYEI